MTDFFKKYPALIVFIAAALLITTVFVFYELMYHRQNRQQQKAYEELNKTSWITEVIPEEEENPESEEETERRLNRERMDAFLKEGNNASDYRKLLYSHPNFESYWQINEEVVGHVLIPDTRIDYPVLYNAEVGDYYLKRNIDGSTGYPGCIYIEDINRPDLTDPVTILYGHNMLDGTMFGELGKLYRKAEFREGHPYIFLYTPEAVNVYEVIACSTFSDDHLFFTYYEKDGEGDFCFTELPDNAQVQILDKIKDYGDKNAFIKEDVSLTESDRMLVLSTCYGDRRRFVVAGKLLFSNGY